MWVMYEVVEVGLAVYRRDRSIEQTVSVGLLRDTMTTGGMIKAEEVLCDSSSRVELYSVCYFHPRPRGLVILVHSFQERSGQYQFLVRALWHAKFSVYLFDWRRQSRSRNEWPDMVYVANVEELLEDLKLTIEQARSREDNRKIFVIGHDIGAAVAALNSASIEGSKVAGIIVFTPALTPPVAHTCTGSLSALLSVLWPRWKMTVERKGTLDEMFVRTVRSCYHLSQKVATKPKDLIVPLLVMCGTQDSTEEVEASRKWYGKVGSEDKKLLLFEGKSEDVWSDAVDHPGAFASVINWLEERTNP